MHAFNDEMKIDWARVIFKADVIKKGNQQL